MKKLTLLKTSGSIQLAHLYEHVFCADIDRLFSKKGLYPYLDYSLSGMTYYGGVVVISIDLYTEFAVKTSRAVLNLASEFTDQRVQIAMMQLVAEKEVQFESKDLARTIQSLKEVDATPWQNIDEVDLIDATQITKRARVFKIVEGTHAPARKLKVGVILPRDVVKLHRELLPFYRQLAHMIIFNFQSNLADAYGLFSLENVYTNAKAGDVFTNTFNVAYGRDVDLKSVARFCNDVVMTLQQDGAFKRLIDELHATNYYDHAESAPNLQKNYEETLTFIGSQGWRRLATRENYDLLIRNMSINYKFGRQSFSQGIEIKTHRK